MNVKLVQNLLVHRYRIVFQTVVNGLILNKMIQLF